MSCQEIDSTYGVLPSHPSTPDLESLSLIHCYTLPWKPKLMFLSHMAMEEQIHCKVTLCENKVKLFLGLSCFHATFKVRKFTTLPVHLWVVVFLNMLTKVVECERWTWINEVRRIKWVQCKHFERTLNITICKNQNCYENMKFLFTGSGSSSLVSLFGVVSRNSLLLLKSPCKGCSLAFFLLFRQYV